MELYGRDYVVEHCVAVLKAEQKEKRYRSYISDVLRLIGENAAALAHGSYIPARWAELDNPPPEDTRTPDEIAADIITRAGLTFAKGGD